MAGLQIQHAFEEETSRDMCRALIEEYAPNGRNLRCLLIAMSAERGQEASEIASDACCMSECPHAGSHRHSNVSVPDRLIGHSHSNRLAPTFSSVCTSAARCYGL